MPIVSVIMPIYNVETYVGSAIESVLAQTFSDFELIVVDDKSPDGSAAICRSYDDPRIRIISHDKNCGLAAARNTGIRHAIGRFLAFLDSDDLWTPDKLARHVAHLEHNPEIGVSFSRSEFIDESGQRLGYYQMPRLRDIEPGYYLCRNPIGNGSAPVLRREVFDDVRPPDCATANEHRCYFDEDLRRSEDIECWIRIALTTRWQFAGLPHALTQYRLNSGGLSASLYQQLESWEQALSKTRAYAAEFVALWEQQARAFQLRYLARQAIRLGDGPSALQFAWRALRTDAHILINEPIRTIVTLTAAIVLCLLPESLYQRVRHLAQTAIGQIQNRKIVQEENRHASRTMMQAPSQNASQIASP